ncbi:MAG: ribonuclease HII [Selenomonadaceae bacterium]|nr:ribonuclease HII [Selenomonadaceae bacterium]
MDSVQALRRTRKFSIEADKERVKNLYQIESEVRTAGFKNIAGVDEAGRGSLIGCLVVAAVILPDNLYLERLNDSKKISAKIRDNLYDKIIESAISYRVEIVSMEEIDSLNVYHATAEGMKRAVNGLDIRPDYVLTDAMKIDFAEDISSRAIIHGDALSASIAAASILAKVTRDRLTDEWALTYPQYGFDKNRGYGTKAHLDAIKKFGASAIHRRSFEPVKSLLANEKEL